MTKLAPRSTKRVLKALARAGWHHRPGKPGKGHHILVHRTLPGIVSVPRHPETRKGTLAQIIKQAGLTLREFDKLYR